MPRKIILILIAAVVLGASGAAVWRFGNHGEAGNNKLTLYGNVDIRQVQLAFNGSERIASMKVREGEQVKKGQLLATLDTVRLAGNVDLQQAQLASQRQVVARLEAGSRPEEISKAQADVEAARIDAENAESNYQRMKKLAEQHFVSAQQADDARAKSDAAKARYASLQETLKLVQQGPRKEDIAAARAMLKADQAALDVARKALADASLYAPESGIIQERILEPGDMASPQRPVYTLALTDPIWVRAYVQESDLGKLQPGMRAEVSTDSFPGKKYRAWVGYISPSAEFTPKAVETTEVRSSLVYQVRIFVCDSQGELRLGMPATVTIAAGQPPVAGDDHCAQS
ncbi:MAG TPA: efflux RND transporter periplasmic adaptor subunit [Gallionella sp.]|nr:efflux RND transporter periplasmic adaptor subunit [Gallionella sp.]